MQLTLNFFWFPIQRRTWNFRRLILFNAVINSVE